MTEDYLKTTNCQRTPRPANRTTSLTFAETLIVMIVIAGAISMRNLVVRLGLDNFSATLVAMAIIFVGACLAAWFQTNAKFPRAAEVRVRGSGLNTKPREAGKRFGDQHAGVSARRPIAFKLLQ